MIEDIENHFKNKIFFTSSREFREYDTLRMGPICLTGLYKSNLIHNNERHGFFKDSNDVVAQIKSFLYYLASKCMKREEDDFIFSGFLEVGFFFHRDNEKEYEYIKVKNYCIETSFLENNYLYLHCFKKENYLNERFFNEPFEIHIDVSCDYTPRMEVEQSPDFYETDETRSGGMEEATINAGKTFKS